MSMLSIHLEKYLEESDRSSHQEVNYLSYFLQTLIIFAFDLELTKKEIINIRSRQHEHTAQCDGPA
jgi:hypothetical protein